MAEIYLDDTTYEDAVQRISRLEPSIFSQCITKDQIRIALGEAGVWPTHIRPRPVLTLVAAS